jgi:protein ImuB
MHWIALQPTLDVEAQAPLADAFTAWAWWALQFTPLVARLETALVLEISTSERLFGGRATLLGKLLNPDFLEQNQPSALMKYAQGATSLIAFGRLLCDTELTVDVLPLRTLVAARPHLPTLARLGLRNWGQLRAMPRGGLVRRFGTGLVDAMDRAYGSSPEVYPWLSLPEVFDAPLELTSSVETAAAMLFGARRLLTQLQVWLRARQQGVLALELVWELDARRSNALHVDAHHRGGGQGRLELRTAQATQDVAHLARLLAEQLAQVSLPAPVLNLRLRSLQTLPVAGESGSLLPDDVRQGDSLHQLIERLGARLGPAQVRCVTHHADHRPERMQSWCAAAGPLQTAPSPGSKNAIKNRAINAYFTRATGQFYSQGSPDWALYPSWLLATPLRLKVVQGTPFYQGRLTLLTGPQRLEAGWLEGDTGCAMRDYYMARSASVGLVWVYRERLGHQACWYLHGLYG